jgi:SNF2 family DNA or RNA helicase
MKIGVRVPNAQSRGKNFVLFLNACLRRSHVVPTSVIFSCWSGMLDLIAEALRNDSFDFTRIDGKMTETSKRESIRKFRGGGDCNILLATVGSAGVG